MANSCAWVVAAAVAAAAAAAAAATVSLLRQLFDRWCTDDKNGVLIPGYSVEGTLAKKLLSMPDEVQGMDGRVRQNRQ